MKKLLLFSLLALQATTYSSPNCLGHTGLRFRKSSLEKVDCNCPCQKYPRAAHENGYKCLTCDHTLIPASIQAPAVTIPILKSLAQLKKEQNN